MVDPPFYRCRVLCDFDRKGNLIQMGWELHEDGELTRTGCFPVGPFDTPQEVEQRLATMLGVPLTLDLS